MRPVWCLLACLVAARAQQKPGPSNRVLGVKTTCNKEGFTVSLEMEKPFKGLVFSKDFSRECQAQGKLLNSITLHLPSNACGVRTAVTNGTDEEAEDLDLYYGVELVVQMDRQLQQSTDQEIFVRCKLQPLAVRITSSALESEVQKKMMSIIGAAARRARTGRTRSGFLPPPPPSRLWMQLAPAIAVAPAPAPGKVTPDRVEVGQPTRLTVEATLPVGIGLRVTNCVAHDGLGEASQKLLDEAGCPIDETIFSQPTVHRPNHEIDFDESLQADDWTQETDSLPKLEFDYANLMTHQHAVTTFAAFKFPDRAKLHLTCGIELCKGDCPVVDCKVLHTQHTKDGLVRKARLDQAGRGNVIDRLEVFNSIEVLAPNIELDDEASIRGSRRIEGEEDFLRGFSPGDKTICLSPGKMALAFCVLGVIFLCAIAVAFVSLIRARRRLGREPLHTSLSFYTGSKSIFSSSGSSSSGLSGSKLLLTDSPYLDHHSTSSNNWPYSRAY